MTQITNKKIQVLNLKFVILNLFVICVLGFGIFGFVKEAKAGIIVRPVFHAGLVGYWDFQEGAGMTANDHSGNSNHGDLTNMTEDDWVDGKIGQALEFDGSNNSVNFPDQSEWDISATGAMTITAWFNIDTLLASDDDRMIFANGTGGGGSVPQYDLRIKRNSTGYGDTDTHLTMFYRDDNLDTITSYNISSDALAADTWYHGVVVINPTTDKHYLYLNGEQVDGDSASVVGVSNSEEERIGCAVSDVLYFLGLIDEVRIYNRALSAGEVERLYKLSQPTVAKGTSNTGLVGYWPFEEGTGLKAGDHSGQGNHGDLTNMEENDWVDGKLGTALDFDGGNDYVDVDTLGNLGSNLDNPTTIAFWVKTYQTTKHRIGGTCNDGSTTCLHIMTNANSEESEDSGKIAIYQRDQTPNSFSAGTTNDIDFNDGNWHHLVLIIDGSNNSLEVWMDGQSKAVSTNEDYSPDNFVNFQYPWVWGAWNYQGAPQDCFQGLIDEVRIYNRVLSASEVEALYKSGRGNVSTSQTNRLTDGLVGMWSFDGKDIYWPANMAVDRSGQGNHGAITNMNTSTAPTTGIVGQALEFDGSDDYVDMGTDALDMGVSDFSISAWIKLNDTDSGTPTQLPTIVSKGASSDGIAGYWFFYYDSNNYLRFTIGDDVSRVLVNGTTDVNDNIWHHVTAVADRDGDGRIYIDGVLDNSNSFSSKNGQSLDTASQLRISREDGDSPNTFFPGLIDEVRIYNRALSADEIKRLYNMGR